MNPEKYKRYVKNCYERNRQKYIAKTSAWREANKEYVAEKQKTYNRNRVDNLRDTYVKNLIKGKTEIPIATIPQALIEAKRLQLKIRRMTNEKHNTTT
jgi:pyruvate/2-oxoglutarate dehydrogenase complex dihydrolipoamide acyltransferase (E2) component